MTKLVGFAKTVFRKTSKTMMIVKNANNIRNQKIRMIVRFVRNQESLEIVICAKMMMMMSRIAIVKSKDAI